MTDNEIIKALECCTNGDCDCCPCNNTNDCGNLHPLALDAIRSLQAHIKEISYAYDRCHDEKNNLEVTYKALLGKQTTLEKRIEFLNGECEAYKYCISKIGG